jgi:hypothetical protein
MNVVCPVCMKDETVRLDVADGDTLTCCGCDAEFTVTDVRALVDGWAKLLPWLEAHPAGRPSPPRREPHTVWTLSARFSPTSTP